MGKKSRDRKRKASKRASHQSSQAIKRLANPKRKRSRAATLAGKAAAAWNQLDFDDALKLFNSAHHAERGNVNVLLDLARAHLLRYDPQTAQDWFDQALRLSGRSASALLRVGESFRKIPRYDLAFPWFEEASKKADCPLDGIVDLGVVAERLHRLEIAHESVEKVLSKEAAHPEALILRSKLQRRSGDPGAAELTLRDLISRGDIRRKDAAWQARYQLGIILDREGDYDGAMEQWQAAKKLLQREARQFQVQSEGVLHETRRMLDTITAGHFKRWKDRLVDPKTIDHREIAVLTGHPRSGTTLLEQILDSHDGMISSDESTVFGDEISTPIRRRVSDRDQTFTDLIDGLGEREISAFGKTYFKFTETFIGEPIGDRLLLDKNPALTMQLPTMCAMFPGMGIILALRDPRDVVISCFMQSLYMNSISSNYLDLGATCRQYAAIMDSWLKIRDLMENRWIELRYEDLVGQPEDESRRVLKFLGLPWDPKILEFHDRARTRYVSSPTYEAVTRKIHRGAIGRWKNYEKYLEPHLETLQPYVDAFGY